MPRRIHSDSASVSGRRRCIKFRDRDQYADRNFIFDVLNLLIINNLFDDNGVRGEPAPCRVMGDSVSLATCCPLVKIPRPRRVRTLPAADYGDRLRLIPHRKRPGAGNRHRSRCFRCGRLCGWLGRLSCRRGAPPRGSGLFLGCFFLSRLPSRLFFRRFTRKRLARCFACAPLGCFPGQLLPGCRFARRRFPGCPLPGCPLFGGLFPNRLLFGHAAS